MKKILLSLVAALACFTTAKAQVFNIFPVDHSWKYLASTDPSFCMNDTGWESPAYDDSAWPAGPGGFTGGENTAATLTSLAGLLNTTSLPPPSISGGRPQYFRTHFNVTNTVNLSLILSNRIDDQAVFYVNGTRVADYRHPTTQTDNCAPAGAGGDEATVWVVITLTPEILAGIIQTGDNLLTVSVHQNAVPSSDMVFVCILSGRGVPLQPQPQPIAWTNGTSVITFDTLPPPAQWSTRTWAGVNSSPSDFTSLDAAAKTNDASTITNSLDSSTGNPAFNAQPAVWSDAGFIQTRPANNGYCGVMATLTNATGRGGSNVGVRYTLTINGAFNTGNTEEVPGYLVYYSTTGTPGSWVQIPELSDSIQDQLLGPHAKSADITLSSPWAAHGLLYFLWVDDNARLVSPDNACEIDNVQFVIPNLETNTFNGVSRIALMGTPAIFVNGQFTIASASTNRDPVQVAIQTTFTNGIIIYTLDGSDPGGSASVYSGPFVVARPATVRALAYTSDLSRAVEADPLDILFTPIISATTAGGGTVNVSTPDAPYSSNSIATLTATAAAGWTFLGWNGDASGTDLVTMVAISQDRCVEAVFGTAVHTDVPEGGGSILLKPDVELYPFGSVVRMAGLPQAGDYFGFWTNAARGTKNPLNFTITNANPTVAAVFYALSAGQYALTIIPAGGGSVLANNPGSLFTSGQNVVLTALPEFGQDFIGWSGSASGTNRLLILNMNSNKVVTANFTQRPHLALAKCGTGTGVGAYQLFLTAPLATEYEIWTSTNFLDWANWTTLSNSFGTLYFRDPSAGHELQRFYRAMEP